LDGLQVYNNAAYWNPATDGGWIRGRDLSVVGTSPRFIMNNIVYSTTPTMVDLDNSISLDHNLYWLTAASTAVWKYGQTSAGSIEDFRDRSGQERNGGFADPRLNNPTYSDVGKPSVQFTPMPGSPAIGTGAAWATIAPLDFLGNSLPAYGAPDMGANDVTGSKPGLLSPGPWVNVISKNSGKCLEVTGISTAAAAPMQQWDCLGGDNQKLRFTPVPGGYKITAENSGLQLGVSGGPGATQDGVQIVQEQFRGASNEIWQVRPTLDGFFSIIPLNSGKCLDVTGVSTKNGATIQQWTCTGGENQKWQLVPFFE
ncbi:MAG: RICIN domain-containing protein, partial [Acidobacteriaceae bacterium]|nr:RICIN domain-containing protein [Acidobacteriaceae bacterium]